MNDFFKQQCLDFVPMSVGYIQKEIERAFEDRSLCITITYEFKPNRLPVLHVSKEKTLNIVREEGRNARMRDIDNNTVCDFDDSAEVVDDED